MKPIQIQSGGNYILYDAELPVQAGPDLFDASAWAQRGQLSGGARGRGEVVFLRDGAHEYVLRHYRRGGLPGHFIHDRYLWTGLAHTRAWREWHLTAELYARGLPVPRPVAVRVEHHGLWYRADLITERIPQARSLAQALAGEALDGARWQAIGRCVRRFHDAGLYHADLNAHNILLSGGEVFIIDFDRGRLRADGSWRRRNLERLLRSLRKLYNDAIDFTFHEEDWQALLAGYGPHSAITESA